MSKKVSLIRAEKLAKVGYAYASRVPEGMDLLFLAGSCPINKDMKVDLINDFTEQAKLCVENLKEALKECGASLEDVAYTRILVASHVWDVISDEFGEHDVPSTLTGVTVLGYENQIVEIEAVVAVERK